MNRLGARSGRRGGRVRQFAPVGSEHVASITITTPPPVALAISDTSQIEVLLSSAPMPVLSDASLPYQPRTLTGRVVTWESSNAAVATVSASGLVTAVAAGSATITATSEGVRDTIAVSVAASPTAVASVTVTPNPVPLLEGGTVQVAAVVKNAAGNVLLGRTVTWGTANAGVAAVSTDSGDESHTATVTGVAAGGPTNITATSETVPGTTAVTVSVAPSGSEFVTFTDPLEEFILGPLLVSQSVDNPWPEYDTKLESTGTTYATNAPAFAPKTSPGGTVSITNGTTALAGSGTTFLSRVGRSCRIWITDSGGTMRGPFLAVSVASDIALTLATTWSFGDVTGAAWTTNGGSGLPGQSGNSDLGWFVSFSHYYDLSQSLRIAARRTGNAAYLTASREQADAWYAGVALNGTSDVTNTSSPREAAIPGLILRALDGRPDMWDWIHRYTDYMFNSVWLWPRRNNAKLHFGVRDGAFCMLFAVQLAKCLPDTYRNTADTADIDGVAKRAFWLQRTTDMLTLYYDRLQDADGGFYGDSDYAPDFGVVAFHLGYLLEALILLHKLIRDNPTYASQTAVCENVIVKLCDCIWTRVWSPKAATPATGSPTFNWRAGYYEIFRSDSSRQPTGLTGTGGDLNFLRSDRQRTVMWLHAFGYAFHLTGDIKYLTQGDEMFAATLGFGTGPATDGIGGEMTVWNTAAYVPPVGRVRGKEFNQSVRSAGRYLARRVGSTD